MTPPVVLASGSPRRRELLGRVGLEVVVDPADVDESERPGERPEDYVARLARTKAGTVAARRPGTVVVAADTAVVAADGRIVGQPDDDVAAADGLRRLAGATHRVLTAVCVVGADGAHHEATVAAAVVIAPLGEEEIAAYVATGEPRGKAGGYAVQGVGAALVERVEGDPTTVVGLPLRATLGLLGRAGVAVPFADPTRDRETRDGDGAVQ